jgi:Integrase core domain/Chromo (CHRromatin Organisation MOdifier) domain
MDFIVELPKSEGKTIILVIVDRFTKYAHFFALSHPFSASDIAHLFINEIYKLHGLPLCIVSDRDAIFTSKFWRALMEKLGVKLNFSSAYHPQSDGQTERVNQCIENYLRCMVLNQPKWWNRWLPLAEHWYNTTYHTVLKTTHFQALYGYAPTLLPTGAPPRSEVEAVNEMMQERHQTTLELKKQLMKAQDTMKKYADEKRSERTFQAGDWVFLKLQPYRQLSVSGTSHSKLNSKFYGPFEVFEKIDSVAYKLKLPPHSQIHPVIHVSQLKPRVGRGEAVEPTLPVMGPQRGIKLVPEKILARKITKKNNEPVVQVLIKWVNTVEEDSTWENYQEVANQYPDFILRDKNVVMKEGVSADSEMQLIGVGGNSPFKRELDADLAMERTYRLARETEAQLE